MLEKFDNLVRRRRELRAWLALSQERDHVNGEHYTLRVDAPKLGMVAYCGQHYPGAKNYHEPPSWFLDVVSRAMRDAGQAIVLKAAEKELENLSKAIEAMRAEVLNELQSE